MNAVKKEIQNYGGAIRRSTGTADIGVKFAEKAKILCTYLLDQNTPIEAVRSHINEMRDLAKEAHKKALATKEQFRTTRESFYRVRGMARDVQV